MFQVLSIRISIYSFRIQLTAEKHKLEVTMTCSRLFHRKEIQILLFIILCQLYQSAHKYVI